MILRFEEALGNNNNNIVIEIEQSGENEQVVDEYNSVKYFGLNSFVPIETMVCFKYLWRKNCCSNLVDEYLEMHHECAETEHLYKCQIII